MAGGRGHIRKRGTAWYLVLELDPHPDGRRRQQWVRTTARTKKEAEQERTRLLRERDTGSDLDPTTMTVGQYLPHWLATTKQGHVTDGTLKSYRLLMNKHLIPALGKTLLVKLTAMHVARCYADLIASGLAPRTMRNVHVVLGGALADAVRWRLIQRNVSAETQLPRVRNAPRDLWDAATLQTVLAASAGHQFEGLIHLLAGTGMRRGELLALQWRDVQLDEGVVTVQRGLAQHEGKLVSRPPKTAASRRRISLAATTIAALRAHRIRQHEARLLAGAAWQDNDLVFPNLVGKLLWPSYVEVTWSKMIASLGVAPLHMHDLRHLHATLLLEAGVHPKVVQERLGHTSIKMTMDLYSHVSVTMQKTAATAIDAALRPGIVTDQGASRA